VVACQKPLKFTIFTLDSYDIDTHDHFAMWPYVVIAIIVVVLLLILAFVGYVWQMRRKFKRSKAIKFVPSTGTVTVAEPLVDPATVRTSSSPVATHREFQQKKASRLYPALTYRIVDSK